MKKLIMAAMCMMVAGLVQAQNHEALVRELAYLKNIPEVRLVEFDGNAVYVHFKKLPNDWKDICSAAALNGNRANDFGVNVWAVLNAPNPQGWQGGDPCEWWKCITARYGKIEH